ncbi:DUF1990 family protein, partial [Streptomyces sp. NPDC088184]|uniref:DUF1990 family protein n=1 Tax=Streptomyces sp. NPDC088184 TaxID=3160991 RepID=UPI00343CFA39
MSTLSYPEVGATRLGPLPDGYHHLHHRTRVGRGRACGPPKPPGSPGRTGWRTSCTADAPATADH